MKDQSILLHPTRHMIDLNRRAQDSSITKYCNRTASTCFMPQFCAKNQLIRHHHSQQRQQQRRRISNTKFIRCYYDDYRWKSSLLCMLLISIIFNNSHYYESFQIAEISAFSLSLSTKERFLSISNFNERSQYSRNALLISRQQQSIYATITPAPTENSEMEYTGRSHKSTDSWKAVPGGFLPQIPKRIGTFSQKNVDQEAASQRISEQEEIIQKSPSSTLNSSKSKGNISSSPMKRNSTPNTSMTRIRQLSTLQDYKHYVVDDIDPEITTITVVRFYAPWCRACQAIQQRYYRLAQLYEQRQIIQQPPSDQESIATSSLFSIQQPGVSSTEQKKVLVRFMECPVTKDNAILHQGLGVPSLPYGHIYHSHAGLVEEMKLNKNVFAKFESTLASYVNGYCNVNYGDDDIVIDDDCSSSIESSSRTAIDERPSAASSMSM